MDNNELDFSIETKLYRASVLKCKMMQFQAQKNRVNHKWLKYVNSTTIRFMFATWIVQSFYSDRSITAALITAEMGVSRKAIDEMVSDWLAEEWLYREQGTGSDAHKMYLHPSDEILRINNEWFEWYEESIVPIIEPTLLALRASKVDYKVLKETASFDPVHTTNLSGIDNKVTSFILKSNEKQRRQKD